ncbi:MAG: alpha/beta hydrolase [Pseudomonadota bacterium]
MPSLRAKLLNRYIRRTIKPRPLMDMEPEIVRKLMNNRPVDLSAKSVDKKKLDHPSLSGEWHVPAGQASADTSGAILYCHGGGYVFGSVEGWAPLTTRLAKETGLPVLSLDYRLAPEHPCPAAIEDALAAFDHLASQGYDPAQVFVGGDSAGGGLTLALLQALKARGTPQPGGAFLYSPWADLSSTGASYYDNDESDAMFQGATVRGGGVKYAGELPLDDPRVSPLFGDLAGLAPMVIFASTDELFRDDAICLQEKVSAIGGEAELHLEEGLVHVWPVFAPLIPEAKAAIDTTARFISGIQHRKKAA